MLTHGYCLNCLLVILSLSAYIRPGQAKEPECPFGSPKIDIADLDGRCDRFWICEDGLISDVFCSSGSGFDPQSLKCHENAPCIKDSSQTTDRPDGLARIVDILVTKSLPAPTGQSEKKSGKSISISSFISPLILPLMRMFF